MKAKIIAGVGVIVLIVALAFSMKPKSFDSQFEKTMEDMDSYILSGDMEITKGEDMKTYTLEVGYQKEDKELFKVSLVDKELNQEQVILRNDDGVFVVTPSLNQVFKFEGDWPMNSPKPYLLQSIAEIVKSEKADINKKDDGYLVSSKVNYPNNKNFDHEEIMFDKDAKLKWIQIFDQDNSVQLKIVFSKSDYDTKIKDGYFDTPKTLESKASANGVTEADLPLYPVQVFESDLNHISKLENGSQVKHVLEYTGTKNFTVVETMRQSVEETQTVLMPGEMVDSLDVIGFYDGNHMSVIHDGVEYTVYSEELGPEEMMQVINSMQVAVMK